MMLQRTKLTNQKRDCTTEGINGSAFGGLIRVVCLCRKMSSLIRGGGPLVISFGTGVVIGASATYVYMQLSRCISRDLASLIETVQTLRRDIEELRSYIIIGQQLKTKTSRSLASGNQEIRNSSAEEDDDVYEEAYGGYALL